MSDKDKEFEISIGFKDAKFSMKFKNRDSYVGAFIGEAIVDQLSWFRWKTLFALLINTMQ